MQVIIFLDKKHSMVDVKDKICSVLPNAKSMIFDTKHISYTINQGMWLSDYETFIDCVGHESEPIQTGWRCSLCGNSVSNPTPYCSQCGAEMKTEGVNDDTL